MNNSSENGSLETLQQTLQIRKLLDLAYASACVTDYYDIFQLTLDTVPTMRVVRSVLLLDPQAASRWWRLGGDHFFTFAATLAIQSR